MKTSMSDTFFGSVKRRFMVGAVLLGITGSQLGCGCECATVATAIAAATPAIMVAREIREAREAEIQRNLREAAKNAE